MESLSAFLHALRLHWYPKCLPLFSAVVCLHWCLGAQRLVKALKALRYLWMDVCALSFTMLTSHDPSPLFRHRSIYVTDLGHGPATFVRCAAVDTV